MSRAQDSSKNDRATGHSTASSTLGQTWQTYDPPTEPGFLIPWTFPPAYFKESREKRQTRYTEEEKAEAWKETTEVVQHYSDEMIRRWNSEIDTYLTFAGLFSAVLTAFNAQSYLLLQPASPDLTLAALQQISLQLSSFSTGPAFVNSTQPAFQQSGVAPERPSRAVIWLNSMWFSSLILSLASAFVGILVKQWLNEYVSGISSESGTSRQQARLRQYRLNNLVKWRVGAVVNSIPVLLQLAVALFLAGLLVLLWTLDQTVAIVSSVFTGLLAVFALVTMLLPSFKAGCAYLSPQSLALYHVFRRIPSIIQVQVEHILSFLAKYFATPAPKVPSPILRISQVFGFWTPRKARSLHGIEKSTVAENSQSLDADIIATAYKTAMDPDSLATAAICLSELDSRPIVISCIDSLVAIDEAHFGASPSEHLYSVVGHDNGPVVFELLADWLLCFFTHWSDTGRPWGGLTFERLGEHMVYYSPHHRLPSSLSMASGMERLLTTLVVATNPRYPLYRLLKDQVMNILALVFDGIQEILRCCNRNNLPVGHVTLRHAIVAAHRRVQDLRADVAGGSLPVLYEYISCTNILLECVARAAAISDIPAADRETLLACVEYTLPPLTNALRSVAPGPLAELSQFDLISLARQLYQLINLVTGEPALPVNALFSQDSLSDLERAATAVRDMMLRRYIDEDRFKLNNRAGYLETFEAKMERLRAVRSRYTEAVPHVAANPAVGADEFVNLSTTDGVGPSAVITGVAASAVTPRSPSRDGPGTAT